MGAVASLLADHVAFRLSCVDRIFVQGYVPRLQSEGLMVRFLLDRGFTIPSPALLGKIHDRLIGDVKGFVADAGLEIVRFERRESKEERARPALDAAARSGREGVVFVGVAQERANGWRGFKTAGGSASHPHFAYRRQALHVNHYYFYIWDRDWGPTFIKLCPYAPYSVWSWLNGHEWLKRQLDQHGVGYRELDNGLRACDDPEAAQRLAAGLSAGRVRTFLARWLAHLPSPLTDDDHDAGYRYEFSVRQFEFSDTAVFDRPQSGRAWFEAAIRDHLDLGRPERVSLVVDRRINSRTSGRFETRLITKGVDPQIQIHYRSSKVKAYFKESRALRVETTINNTRDFDIRKTVNSQNWDELTARAAEINARFLEAVGEAAPPPPDVATLQAVVMPTGQDGSRAPGLRFGEPRVMALFAALACFAHLISGLTNKTLRELMTQLLDTAYGPRQATYDLRRLRRKGLIERIPGRHLYRITPSGRALATFLTKLHARVVVPTLTSLDHAPNPPPATDRSILIAWQHYERELDNLIDTKIAA